MTITHFRNSVAQFRCGQADAVCLVDRMVERESASCSGANFKGGICVPGSFRRAFPVADRIARRLI
jgi:hypothetical protein